LQAVKGAEYNGWLLATAAWSEPQKPHRAWVRDVLRLAHGYTSGAKKPDAVRAARSAARSHCWKDMDALAGLEAE
jgi:hypothetical protein